MSPALLRTWDLFKGKHMTVFSKGLGKTQIDTVSEGARQVNWDGVIYDDDFQ